MTFKPLATAAVAALWMALAPGLSLAQTAPAKPADNKTSSLGAGSSRGPILTRDELRACLSQQETMRTRGVEHEGRRAPLDSDKAALGAQQTALRGERGPLDDIKRQADELGARITAQTARVEAWNKKVADFNTANKIGPSAERERAAINREREEIDAASKALNDDRTRISAASEAAVVAYNAKAAALDARVNEWNVRNQAWNDAGRELDAERKAWVASCGDRRYREDDEIAIRRGR